jgi:arylsulfatase A-like enzyme
MTLRILLFVVAMIGAASSSVEIIESRQASRPNVVLIITDDLGYGDLGSYGGTDAKTPNLDRLARDGVRLTDAYSNGANCSPTRSALITGRYQQRVGIEWPLASERDLDRGLPVTGASLPALLKKNGYATGLIGKWHLGFKPEFGPNAHGFDEFFGFLSGAVDYYSHLRGDGVADLYENTTPVESSVYLTDEISRRAVSFVDRHARTPFFLEVAYNATHWPFQPPDRRPSDPKAVPRPQEKSDLRLLQGPEDPVPATRQDYVRMLERTDEGVGAILSALERHGLTKNTLVIFTNDNGGEWLSRNAPLAHRKSTLWEGGIRVPLILRWPERLPRGKTSAQVAATMDVTASILAATGTPMPSGHRLDGIDILPALAGGSPVADRQLFWRIARPQRQQKAVRSGRWKLLIDGGAHLLFDLAEDAGERRDLAAVHPDIVKKLTALHAGWEKDVDSKPTPAAH